MPGCPSSRRERFRWSADKHGAATSVTNGERTPGKVAIFATCYVNYNEPGIGHDLLKVLEHNEIPYELVEKESCCGMPKLELGDLESVARHKEANIPVLAKYAQEGFAIVTAVPCCTLMFKQELPLMFPDDADVQAVQEAMFDPFEYLVARHKDGLLKTDFTAPLGKVSYHVPCHGRVQKIGRKTEEMFKLIGQRGRARAQHGRALLRPRRHLRREDADASGGDEDRQAGVQGDGEHGRARLHQLRLPARRASHRAGHGERGSAPQALAHPLSLLRLRLRI